MACPSLQQAKGGLQLGPHGEHGGRILETGRQRERRWRVAPCAAQHARLARHNPRDAIVEAVHDIAVMHQEIIGDAGQPLAGFVVADALRLVAAVARGEHNRAREVFHQEMMERRVGQHEAERRLAGRDAGGQRGRMGARCWSCPDQRPAPHPVPLPMGEGTPEWPLRVRSGVPSPMGRGTG